MLCGDQGYGAPGTCVLSGHVAIITWPVAAPICLDPGDRHVALCNHRLWEEVEQGLRKCVEWVSAEAQCPALPTGGCSGEPPAGQEVKQGQSSG